MRTCTIEGCGKKHHAHGYCNHHAWNLYAHGNPLISKKQPKLSEAERRERRRITKIKYKKSEKGLLAEKRYETSLVGRITSYKNLIKRRTMKMKRTPSWLTDLQKEHIRLFYEAAMILSDEIGIKFNVDHIVPLRGKNVSGLHVPWNLQILTASDNFKKGNKYDDLSIK